MLKRTVLIFTALLAFLQACRRDELLTDPSARLEFSTDSILFDTVFTSVGSTTASFKIYNRHDQPIKISQVRLGGMNSSSYRLNVDGTPLVSGGDIEIPARDSIFCFVEVTVDPNSSTTPFVIRDSILFTTNGNEQKVILEAWGRNAYFHYNEIITSTSTWPVDKPHVIYNYVVVDSAATLTIPAGAQIYMHKYALLYVYRDGTLKINGTQGNEVTFQGDRLEPQFNETPGQWSAIYFSALSKNNTIDWAVIKNGDAGIISDTFPSANPTVVIRNTIIRNMAAYGILGRGSRIDAYNVSVSNCGRYNVALVYGGMYRFFHCTFANFWSYDTRQYPTVIVNNWYEDANENVITRPLDSASFYNCIIYGSIDEELQIDRSINTGPAFNYKFHHCLIRTELNTATPNFINCRINQDPNFVSATDLRLSSISSATNGGDLNVVNWFPLILNTDLKGDPRNMDGDPDVGAYEYVP
ncbi:MAG: hypothetical protein AB1458_13495 [Bacteroidota bacterium]